MNLTAFTPVSATIGGVLIALASIGLLLFMGRPAGISGIATAAWSGGTADHRWRLGFLGGLLAGALLWSLWHGGLGSPRDGFSRPLLLVSGLLVGAGTAWAGGCTSGHGVCGLARFSLRSLVSVIVFLTSAMAVTALARHVFHLM
jgi:uncharacterized membrane protein YedE/YeeE